MRLKEEAARKLLQNNAERLIDPDLRRKYNLDLVTNGSNVYEVIERDDKGKIVKKELMARVIAISTFYNDKGSATFDKDFLNDPKMYYNVAVDEWQLEANEKKTFDVMYSMVNSFENQFRNTKNRIRIIFLGNQLQEASDLLCSFNFIPQEFGRYKLKSKRAVIEYMEPTEAYKEMRKGSIADILMPEASTFTNKIEEDYSLINKQRRIRPSMIFKFTKSKEDWFTLWDGNIITKYNNEKTFEVNMRPYLYGRYKQEIAQQIIDRFDSRGFQYKDLIDFKRFKKNIQSLKPRKNG